MGKRKHGKPDTFQRGGFEMDERPASDEAAVVAATRFVNAFVVKQKRERMLAGLVKRNVETIQQVYKWIDSSCQAELGGNTGFPQHLHERFGDLRGIMFDDRGARHVTVAGAAVLSAGQFASVFMADSVSIALLFPEIGPPTLCRRQ